MSQKISQDDFCMTCGEIHTTDNCPFNQEYDGQLENEHHHKIARNEAQEENGAVEQSSFGESVGLALNRAFESRHRQSGDGNKVKP